MCLLKGGLKIMVTNLSNMSSILKNHKVAPED
jgi:hypothetical protein